MRPSYRLVAFPSLFLLLFLLAGCSDDPSGPGELKPFVGVWEAVELVMTNQANPSMEVDIIEMGASFSISILSTGQYAATLTFLGQGTSEMGTVKVSGNTITIDPTQPPGDPLVATWSFQGSYLILDGTSEYDFNQDGIPEDSFAHIVLEPSEG